MEKDYTAAIDKVLSTPTTAQITKDYTKAIDAVIGQKDSQINANLYQASSISPDAAVKQFKINQQTKLPIDTVRRKQKDIEQQYEYSKLASSINDLPPKLRETLRNPALAPVIKDDLDGLSWFERYSTTTFNQPTDKEKAEKERVQNLPLYKRVALDYNQQALLGDTNVDVAQIERKELWGQELSAVEKNRLAQAGAIKQTDYNIPFLLGIPAAARQAAPLMIDAMTSGTALGSAAVGAAIGAAKGAAIGAAKGAAVGGGTAAAAGAVTGPLDVPIAATGALVGAGRGALSGGAKGYSVGTTLAFMEQQAALSYPDYKTMIDFEGKPISPTIARGAAFANGVIGGALEKLSLGVLLKNFPGGEALIGKLSKEGIQEAIKSGVSTQAFERIGRVIESAATEGGTEFLQNVVQEVMGEAAKMASGDEYKPFTETGDVYDWVAGVFERSLEQGKMGVQAGIGLAGVGQVTSIATNAAVKQYQQVKDRKAINTLVKETAMNKTFQRDPQAWEAATQNDLGQKQVHINADSLREFFQSGLKVENAAAEEQALSKDATPKTLEEFLALIPDGQKQYDEAIQYGGNLILPANQVISVLAQHEGLRSMEEFIKINPDALSDDQYTADMLNRILPEITEFEKAQTVENLEGVTKAFETQLLNAGETPDSAKHMAALFNARYQKLAQTTENPDILKEIKNVFKLEIRNQERQERLQAVNKIEDIDLQLDALRKPRSLFNRLSGGKKINASTQPLLSFLKKKGGVKIGSTLDGELRAMGVTPKTNPGLFKKNKGISDVDNFEQSLIQEQLGVDAFVPAEGDYASRDFILERLSEEVSAEPAMAEDTRTALERALDEYALDVNTMSNEEIKQALKDIAGTNDLTGYFQLNFQQDFQDRVTAAQDFADEVKSVNRRIKINADGSINLYHGTSQENATKIRQNGLREQSFLSLTEKETKEHIKQHKNHEILNIKVDPRDIEFSTGTQEVYAPEGLKVDEDGIWKSPKRINQTGYFQDPKAYDSAGDVKTESEAFKKWFGDSKVVDENGKPLVVYHGSRASFEVFDLNKVGLNGQAMGKGFYFTNSKGLAEGYGEVGEYYLSAKNPTFSLDKKTITLSQIKKIISELEKEDEYFLSNYGDVESEGYNTVLNRALEDVFTASISDSDIIASIINIGGVDRDVVMESITRVTGKDGFITNASIAALGAEESDKVFVVLRPTQIKSVNNRGTFDINNPNILYQAPKQKFNVVQSFKTEEGNFKSYDVVKSANEVRRPSLFTVWENKDGWIVRNAIVPEDMQRKGLATDFYIQMNQKSLEKTGKPLRSTQPRTLLNGEVVHELSDDAIKLWDSFVEKGLAEKLGKKDYRFLTQPTFNQAPIAQTSETVKQATQDAIDLTGVTTNPLEAGFIIYDGKMLNLSGKREEGKGQRTTDHSAIAKQLGYENTEKKDALYNFQKDSQAVRVDFKAGLVSANFVPNDRQINAIVKAAKEAELDKITVDYADLPNKIHSYAYIDNINARNIKRVFDEDLNGETLYQSAPEFYSALQRNIEALPQGKGDANQWKGIVRNLTNKGVKQEEIDWLGLNDWLDQQTGSVTKQQILDYITANQVQVSESVKGGDSPYRKFIKSLSDKYGDDWINKMTSEEEIKKEELFADDYEESKFLDTKFGKYVLPGGENYRELLITLPDNSQIKENVSYADALAAIEKGDVISAFDPNSDAARTASRVSQLSAIPEGWVLNIKTKGDNYKSSHYDEPNIVAHLRFNERTDVDGKKVLFVEEIQSDWHQEGRKKGYKQGLSKDDVARLSEIEAETTTLMQQRKDLREAMKESIKTEDDVLFDEQNALNKILNSKIDRLLSEKVALKDRAREGVPDAPFKTSWAELSFKRALMWAVEHGFDKVAWTTGEQQAERYDLSKQVDSINVEPRENGERAVYIVDKANNDLTFFVDSAGKVTSSTEARITKGMDISDVVGKEVSQKIMGIETETTLKDLDLKLGGEGMRAFYDKMLPSMVNKLTKKWGGKVETTKITTDTFTQSDEDLLAQLNDETATQVGDKAIKKDVWALEITPAMRESIQKGLPLFQNNTPAEAPRGSFVFGGNQGSVINIFKGRDKSTVLHELMHFFLEVDKHLLNKFGVELSPESKQTFEGLAEWWTNKASDIQRIAAKADDTYRVSGTVVTDMMGRSLNFATVAEAEKYAADKTKELQEQVKALSAEDIKAMANNFLSNPKSPLEALFNREFHEYTARGFERYLREGKAPSKTLRQAFRNFKAWLLRIYKDIRQLNVQLDDDVRDTFDRMLASDEEIEAMRNELLFRPDKQIMDNLSATEKKDYIKRTENEIAKAKEKLLVKLLKDAEKKHAKWYVEERAKVRAEVEEQVNQFPVYRATHFLKTGKFLDKPTPEDVVPFKMNIKNVRENYQYGNEIADRLPRGLTARDGINPETVATMFDFENAEAMFKTMLNMQDRNKVIDQETDRLMIERHGDALTDGTLEREVLDAMHNTDRASKIAYEISVINRKTGFKGVNKEQFRLKAYGIIQDKQSSRINAGQYYTSEVHAAREAGKYLAKKDYVKAAEWKGKQLLNHYLYQEARIAEKTRDKTYKLFDRILEKDKKLSKSRNIDLVNGARALLAKYNYSRSGLDINMIMAQIQKYDAQTYERLIAAQALVEAPAKDYNKLTVSELAEVRSGVENMFNLSREQFITDATGKKRTVAETRDALVTRLKEVYAAEDKQEVITATTEKEKTMRGILSVIAGLRVTESWTSEMDNNDIDGIFSTTTSRPIQDAVVAYRAELEKQMQEYADLFKVLQQNTPRKEFRKTIPAPELTDAKGRKFEFRDKWQLLHAILHTGNNSNKNKLVAGYGWGEKLPDGSVDMRKWDAFVARMENEGVLTKDDYIFAQGVWDLMEKGKPLAQKAHKAQFGYYFNEITAEPVVTKYGIFRGGYIPAIIDPIKTPDIGDKQDISEIMNSSAVAFTYPAPTKGFTISRNENFTRPLQLDIRVLGSHLDKVLRFAYLSEPVSNVAKLYMFGSLKNTLDGINQGLVKHMIVPWLKRTAQQTVQERGAFAILDKIATTIRQRAGQAIMTLNVSNALQQVTGIVVASSTVSKGKLASASASYGINPSGFLNDIYEKSEFLRLRATNQSFGLHSDINKLIMDHGTWENIKTFGEKHSYVLQRFMQNAVDGIVWQAAFDDAIESGKEFKSAVAFADSTVRQTQGSFEAQDISTAMSGTPFTKLFTQFMPYFNMLYNLNVKETRRIMRDVGYAGAPELFYLYMATISVPAILSTAIVMTLADAWDDEESPWAKLLVNSQISTIANAVPLLGTFVTYGLNLTDDKAYNDKYSISPAIDMTMNSLKAVAQLTKENASAKPIITNGLNGLQIMTGMPVGFVGKPLGYIAAVEEDKESPTGPIDVTRGLITGKGNND